ncbi:hypothetical protein GCM10025771_00420 [Niveibacterium umoris]
MLRETPLPPFAVRRCAPDFPALLAKSGGCGTRAGLRPPLRQSSPSALSADPPTPLRGSALSTGPKVKTVAVSRLAVSIRATKIRSRLHIDAFTSPSETPSSTEASGSDA